MTHRLRFAARSDRGLLRSNNQDSVYAGERLLIVADGMGGHAAGDLASRVVVAAFAPLDEQPPGADLIAPLRRAMDAGNNAIADLVADDPDLDGMGTTATAMLFDGPRMGLAHIGDSRAYLYRNGVLHQLSHDDTFVQSLVDDGRITEDEAAHHPQRNLLLRALNGSDPEPMLTVREISKGDRFLICSDGLSSVVAAEAIADTLAGPDPDKVADTLIELALIGGGPDNVTVIVADVEDVGPVPATIPAAHDLDDPEATGPILPIHMTQRMPRVPLPVLTDAEAEARSSAQPSYDEPDDDEPESSSPADRPRRWRRRGALALAVVVLLGVASTGSLLWVRTQYYVGTHNGQVVIFRGVDGSILGIPLASVAENSCQVGTDAAAGCTPLALADLVQAARDQVTVGITASSLEDARVVMQRLSGRLLPVCDTTPPPTTPASSVPPITTPTTTTALSSTVSGGSATGPARPTTSPTQPTTNRTARTSATGPTRTASTSVATRTTAGSQRSGAGTQGLRGAQDWSAAAPTAPSRATTTPGRATPRPVRTTPTAARTTPTRASAPTPPPATVRSTPTVPSSGVQIPPPPAASGLGSVDVTPPTSPSVLPPPPSSAPIPVATTPQVPGVDCR